MDGPKGNLSGIPDALSRSRGALLRQRISAVMEWAIAMQYRSDNPCDRLNQALGRQQKLVRHMRALLAVSETLDLKGPRIQNWHQDSPSQSFAAPLVALEVVTNPSFPSGQRP